MSKTIPFQIIQFSISIVCQKHFYFNLFNLVKSVLIQTIQFSISMQFSSI